ncbi:9103_t:CDS:2, partial [Funneliformis geosporum]
MDPFFLDRLIFNLVVLNPLDRSLKLDYRLVDNSSFSALYDLDINPSDKRREYVTFWNPHTDSNIYGQVTRKHPHTETADIRHFDLVTNEIGLESLVKCPGCSLNGQKKCIFTVPLQNIVKIEIVGKKQHHKVMLKNSPSKLGTQSPVISINYLQVPSLNLLFQFDGIIIESSTRHLIKDIFAANAVSNIIDLHRNNDLKSMTRQAKVHWNTIWSIFTLDQTTYSTSFHQRKL